MRNSERGLTMNRKVGQASRLPPTAQERGILLALTRLLGRRDACPTLTRRLVHDLNACANARGCSICRLGRLPKQISEKKPNPKHPRSGQTNGDRRMPVGNKFVRPHSFVPIRLSPFVCPVS